MYFPRETEVFSYGPLYFVILLHIFTLKYKLSIRIIIVPGGVLSAIYSSHQEHVCDIIVSVHSVLRWHEN